MKNELENEGRLWVRNALSDNDLELFEHASNINTSIGNRLEWSLSLTKAVGASSTLNNLARSVLVRAKPVRFISFNKTSDSNWALPWHQDRVIAVKNRSEIEGFRNWSQKSGVWHCEPPVKLLETMVFARVHLDDAEEMNGSLELSIGSHKFGRVASNNIQNIVSKLPREVCKAKRGDVLFVKALMLHKSTVSHSSKLRRALRIDYANFDLPEPLSWKY